MTGLVPHIISTLQHVFGGPLLQVNKGAATTPNQARPDLYPAHHVVENDKNQVQKLSAEAKKELEKAGQKVQTSGGTMELYSGKYYAACTVGGILACRLPYCCTGADNAPLGLTHTAVTPLDLVKVRRQVDSKLYKSNMQGWSVIYRAQAVRGIFTGWSPTLLGYSAQGAFKYGWYEFFKKKYGDLAGPEAVVKYKTGLYLAASASAELLADVVLCPLEAVKVRMQAKATSPCSGVLDGIAQITTTEGWAGLYKSFYPLWGRQIPYTMMKFASFETIVEMIYDGLPGNKNDYGKTAQTGVSFTGGYLAGTLCAIVSHPADVMVLKLNTYRKFGESFGAVTSRIYHDIGFKGLWNGLSVRIVMIGTLTGLQWMIYDYFKMFMGFPTTGGGPPSAKEN